MTDYTKEFYWMLRATLEYIDAIPKDIELPAMPGFDRDYVESVIDQYEREQTK